MISTATKILFLTQIFQTVNITIHPLQLIVVARRVPAPVRERPPDGPVHNGRRGEPNPVPVGRRNPNRQAGLPVRLRNDFDLSRGRRDLSKLAANELTKSAAEFS